MRSTASFVFLALLFAGVNTHSQSRSGSIIFAEGFASPNTYTGPLPGFFESWCTDTEDGPYSTRLKLETIGGLLAHYDELFFRFREVDVQ